MYYSRSAKKWYSRIIVDNKCIHLGYADNREEAIVTRKKAEITYFGEFSILASELSNTLKLDKTFWTGGKINVYNSK